MCGICGIVAIGGTSQAVSQEILERMNQSITQRGPDEEVIGAYLRAHTTPQDPIYLETGSVQSYYYVDRLPPIDTIWFEYISVSGPAGGSLTRIQNILYWIARRGSTVRNGCWMAWQPTISWRLLSKTVKSIAVHQSE